MQYISYILIYVYLRISNLKSIILPYVKSFDIVITTFVVCLLDKVELARILGLAQNESTLKYCSTLAIVIFIFLICKTIYSAILSLVL